jgi:hypothetical protein
MPCKASAWHIILLEGDPNVFAHELPVLPSAVSLSLRCLLTFNFQCDCGFNHLERFCFSLVICSAVFFRLYGADDASDGGVSYSDGRGTGDGRRGTGEAEKEKHFTSG